MTRPQLSIDTFWHWVDCGDVDACWPWRGAISKGGKNKNGGYGVATIGDRTYRAHRLALILSHGSISDNEVVCHRCDNRSCCNPNHLFAGSQRDNIADKTAKGRQAKGENIGISKLHPCDIDKIKRLYADGKYQREIAAIFGISQSAVSRVLLGQTWRHVS